MPRLSLVLAAGTALLAAAPAFAQDHTASAAWWQPTDAYGSIGYTGTNYGHGSDAHVGAITGRLDARYGRYFGLEGELAGGVKDDTVAGLKNSLDHQYAGYAVGYLPVLPNADLFVRAGYGDSRVRRSGTGFGDYTTESFNYGAGGHYFFNPHDGVRADYTRQQSNGVGSNADTVSVSYVRKF